jgi:hypothetical protein
MVVAACFGCHIKVRVVSCCLHTVVLSAWRNAVQTPPVRGSSHALWSRALAASLTGAACLRLICWLACRKVAWHGIRPRSRHQLDISERRRQFGLQSDFTPRLTAALPKAAYALRAMQQLSGVIPCAGSSGGSMWHDACRMPGRSVVWVASWCQKLAQASL